MKGIVAIGSALALTLAACGGSDDADESSATPAPQEEPAPDDGADANEEAGAPAEEAEPDAGEAAADEPAEEPADDGGDAGGGTGPSTATVTIEGATYEFSTEGAVVAQCQTDMFGIFSVQLPALGGDGSIAIVALREGTDPDVVGEVNSVEFSVGDDDWVADPESLVFEASDAMQAGMSQVDTVEIDGSTVRGTATFVNELSVYSGGEIETVTGSFEATCGEERLT